MVLMMFARTLAPPLPNPPFETLPLTSILDLFDVTSSLDPPSFMTHGIHSLLSVDPPSIFAVSSLTSGSTTSGLTEVVFVFFRVWLSTAWCSFQSCLIPQLKPWLPSLEPSSLFVKSSLALPHYEEIALSLSLNIWLMLPQYGDGIRSLSFSTILIYLCMRKSSSSVAPLLP
ncbi:hypothetical protein Bca101_082178 [Brassica carinata]